MKNQLFTLLLGMMCISLFTTSCTPPTQEQNLVQLAGETESLSTLVTAIEAAGLGETLSGEGPFTVFAPTNEAFAALPDGTLEMLLKPENKESLAAILKYHVVSGAVMSTDLSDGQTAKTVQGEKVVIKTEGGVSVNGAAVTAADVSASNGVVHIIDEVILPPSMQPKNIVQLAMANEELSTLVAAVKAAGLVNTLSGKGPFTVFAPTNAAFEALPEGTLEALLKPENKDQLTAILTYHVVPAKVMSSDLSNGQTAATVQGENVTVNLTDGVKISGANVVAADVDASNGVVHVIDQVILPPSLQ
ncbi:MAG TPA: fasciclin domain-containing protein [Saprospiraceae bacterium]|nr:fasciclin domain-containing protein [Saprospiraceae bacterium]